jgi:hypothetical protein
MLDFSKALMHFGQFLLVSKAFSVQDFQNVCPQTVKKDFKWSILSYLSKQIVQEGMISLHTDADNSFVSFQERRFSFIDWIFFKWPSISVLVDIINASDSVIASLKKFVVFSVYPI